MRLTVLTITYPTCRSRSMTSNVEKQPAKLRQTSGCLSKKQNTRRIQQGLLKHCAPCSSLTATMVDPNPGATNIAWVPSGKNAEQLIMLQGRLSNTEKGTSLSSQNGFPVITASDIAHRKSVRRFAAQRSDYKLCIYRYKHSVPRCMNCVRLIPRQRISA